MKISKLRRALLLAPPLIFFSGCATFSPSGCSIQDRELLLSISAESPSESDRAVNKVRRDHATKIPNEPTR